MTARLVVKKRVLKGGATEILLDAEARGIASWNRVKKNPRTD